MHKDAGKMTPRRNKDSGENPVNDAPAGEESKRNIKAQSATLPQIPPFLPLLHSDTQEACMMMCLQLIGLKTRKGVIDRAHQERVCPPPIILNCECFVMGYRFCSFNFSLMHSILWLKPISSFAIDGTTPSLSSSIIPVLAARGG